MRSSIVAYATPNVVAAPTIGRQSVIVSNPNPYITTAAPRASVVVAGSPALYPQT